MEFMLFIVSMLQKFCLRPRVIRAFHIGIIILAFRYLRHLTSGSTKFEGSQRLEVLHPNHLDSIRKVFLEAAFPIPTSMTSSTN
jgi:hypothetical protein